MKTIGAFVLMTAALTALGGEALAQHAGHSKNAVTARPAECLAAEARPSLLCAEVPSSEFDTNGTLWITWAQGNHVYVAASQDAKQLSKPPVRVTVDALPIDTNGENRPKVIPAPNGDLYVTFTAKGQKKFTGVVYFSRSLDGGKTFSPPKPVSDEAVPTSQRFDVMRVGPDGRIFIAWLDKRDLFAAKKSQTPYRGAALYYAVSDDRGETFNTNTKGADHSCECCRVAMAIDRDGLPVIVWRHVFEPNLRDHGVMKLNADGSPGRVVRLSQDNWALDGCPHHGPAISITDDGIWHVTWFTDGAARQGQFYARSMDGGQTFSQPMRLGDDARQTEHASVLATGDRVYVIWKEFSGEFDELFVIQSADQGRTWSMPLRVGTTADVSDHPFLIENHRWVYASWATALEGLRLFKIAPVTVR